MPVPFLAIAGTLMVAGAVSAWLLNQKTEEERAMEAEAQALRDELAEAALTVERDALRPRLDALRREVKRHRALKQESRLREGLEELRGHLQQELRREALSGARQQALRTEARRCDSGLSKLHAYERYLGWIEYRLSEIGAALREGDPSHLGHLLAGLPAPEALLPEMHLFRGGVFLFEPEELKALEHGEGLPFGQRLRLSDRALAVRHPHEIPVLVTSYEHGQSRRDLFHGSVGRGAFVYRHLAGGVPPLFPVRVLESANNPGRPLLVAVDGTDLTGELPREALLAPLKRYRRGTTLNVYARDWSPALDHLELSEVRPTRPLRDGVVPVLYAPGVVPDEALDTLAERGAAPVFLPAFEGDSAAPASERFVLRLGEIDLTCAVDASVQPPAVSAIATSPATGGSASVTQLPVEVDLVPNAAYDPTLYPALDETLAGFFQALQDELSLLAREREGSEAVAAGSPFFDRWASYVAYQAGRERTECLEELEAAGVETVDDVSTLVIAGNAAKRVRRALDDAASRRAEVELWRRTGVPGGAEDWRAWGTIEEVQSEDGRHRLHVRPPYPTAPPFEDGELVRIVAPASTYVWEQQLRGLEGLREVRMVNDRLKKLLRAPDLPRRVDPAFSDLKAGGTEWFSDRLETDGKRTKLTPKQAGVLVAALSERDLFVIQGPPGTGKTTVITELVLQTLHRRPGAQVLIVSQQNVAVDNALERIRKRLPLLGRPVSVVRCGSDLQRIAPGLHEFTIERAYERYRDQLDAQPPMTDERAPLQAEWRRLARHDDVRDVDPEIMQVLLQQHQVVGATCVGLSNRRIGLDRLTFDLVIIDEAGRATPPEVVIPLLRARKLILVGDHHQLPHTIAPLDEDDVAALRGLDVNEGFLRESLFERLYMGAGDVRRRRLAEQFRMPDTIGTLVSELFYGADGEPLTNARRRRPAATWPYRFEAGWHDIVGEEVMEGTSRKNEAEADAILGHLAALSGRKDERGHPRRVAVITPYAAQKRLVARYVEARDQPFDLDLKVDTVDGFQGDEADVVLYSTVRTRGSIQFQLDWRRLNVAISRTRQSLIVVGSRRHMAPQRRRPWTVFHDLEELALSQDAVFNCVDFALRSRTRRAPSKKPEAAEGVSGAAVDSAASEPGRSGGPPSPRRGKPGRPPPRQD